MSTRPRSPAPSTPAPGKLPLPELAEMFSDVVVVGTADDLMRSDRSVVAFPPHVRSLIGRLALSELAGCLASCGTVVANDSGLGHMAAAVGAPRAARAFTVAGEERDPRGAAAPADGPPAVQ